MQRDKAARVLSELLGCDRAYDALGEVDDFERFAALVASKR